MINKQNSDVVSVKNMAKYRRQIWTTAIHIIWYISARCVLTILLKIKMAPFSTITLRMFDNSLVNFKRNGTYSAHESNESKLPFATEKPKFNERIHFILCQTFKENIFMYFGINFTLNISFTKPKVRTATIFVSAGWQTTADTQFEVH
jgi:hypothetical protein